MSISKTTFLLAALTSACLTAVGRADDLAASVAGQLRDSGALTGYRVNVKSKSGTVWLNTHNKLYPEVETGGYRESGYGRLHGVEGLNDFLSTKHVYWENAPVGVA